MTDSHSYPVTSDAFRTMKLWFEQQIENAQQDQISGFAERSERGTMRGEKAHSRHCAMFDALQMFLSEFGTVAPAQAANVLSEEERRAVEHARYQVRQASMVQPDCCFDYDLVKDLLRAIDRAYPLPSTDRVNLPGHDETMANLDALTISSTDPRCTCAAIVNPNIPHARFCPLSSPEGK